METNTVTENEVLVAPTQSRFEDFAIAPSVIEALKSMNYFNPTEVQQKTIPVAITGRDMIVLSKTGSGKTAAFGIPMIQLLLDRRVKKAMVLAPTRELAVQVQTEIRSIASGSPIRSTVVYGKHSMNVEIEAIEKGIDILVGTPGRVFDHLEQGNLVGAEFDMLVLDEADRMLDMGFIRDVNKIMAKLASPRLNLLFSATMPDEIVRLTEKYLVDPHRIELESDVKTVDRVEQAYYRVERNQKRTSLLRVLAAENPSSCLIFCNTRFEVDRVSEYLTRKGVPAKSIHGANSQASRLKFLNQFKNGKFGVLVATDVAARGLHIEDLELVINYDVPVEKDSYIHRIGRTGRAGKNGRALTFVSDGDMFAFYMIEEHAGTPIEERELPSEQAVAENLKKFAANSERYGIRFDDEGEEARNKRRSRGGSRGGYPRGASKNETPRDAAVQGEAKHEETPKKPKKKTKAKDKALQNMGTPSAEAMHPTAVPGNASNKETVKESAETAAPRKRRRRKSNKPVEEFKAPKTDGMRRVASYDGASGTHTQPSAAIESRPRSAQVAPAPTAQALMAQTPAVHKAEQTPAAQTPKKKGFFARLFGRK